MPGHSPHYHPAPVVTPLPTPEERGAQLLREEREVRRALRWVYVRAIAGCFFFMLAGLGLMAWAVHSTDQGLALISFWSGLLVGNGGILVTLGLTLSRAVEEGWL